MPNSDAKFAKKKKKDNKGREIFETNIFSVHMTEQRHASDYHSLVLCLNTEIKFFQLFIKVDHWLL
jgi:hypothetical protein